MRNLCQDFLVASGESALIEAGATSEELSAILHNIPKDVIAREVMMWQNPAEWAKFVLVQHRMHQRITGVEDAVLG